MSEFTQTTPKSKTTPPNRTNRKKVGRDPFEIAKNSKQVASKKVDSKGETLRVTEVEVEDSRLVRFMSSVIVNGLKIYALVVSTKRH